MSDMHVLEKEMATALGEKLLREGHDLLEEIRESVGFAEPLQALLPRLDEWCASKRLVRQALSGEA